MRFRSGDSRVTTRMGRTLGGMTSREWTCSGLSKPPKRASTPQESRTSRTPRSGTCAMFVPRRPKMASNSRVPTFSGIDTLISRLSVTVHPRSRIAATMTTIWRPHWLIKHIEPVKEEVPDDDVPDVKVEPAADDDGINGEDGTTPSEGKGAKRKRAPRTKGPCEHGVKHRSQCKVCQRLSARSSALSVQGVRWVTNLRARSSYALSARSAVVHNLRARSSAL